MLAALAPHLPFGHLPPQAGEVLRLAVDRRAADNLLAQKKFVGALQASTPVPDPLSAAPANMAR